MAYIGSTPTSQSFTPGTDYFSGNGSTVAFTLTRPAVSINDLIVVIENVVQKPLDAYTVVGTTLTFTSAPPSGTNNIYVRYMSVNTLSVAPNDLSVTTNKIADGVVTISKLHTTVMQPVNISDKANTSTGYFNIPSGTTEQRPVSPVAGASRFNTTTGFAEYWTGSQWATYGSISTTSVSYLIVAGGGSGNDGYINADFIAGGGGGAGGMITGTQVITPSTSYTVTIGAGGAYTFVQDTSAPGNNSSFSAVATTAIGGGGGGKQSRGGGNGGSGGGGGGNDTGIGSGTSGQGNNGGAGTGNSTGGGGGGKGSAGGTPTAGSGQASSITGTSITYAVGGTGGSTNSGNGNTGTANRGNGGGGAQNGSGQVGANGGSGIVVIAYPSSYKDATATGTFTKSAGNGNTIYTFTGSGTIAF